MVAMPIIRQVGYFSFALALSVASLALGAKAVFSQTVLESTIEVEGQIERRTPLTDIGVGLNDLLAKEYQVTTQRGDLLEFTVTPDPRLGRSLDPIVLVIDPQNNIVDLNASNPSNTALGFAQDNPSTGAGDPETIRIDPTLAGTYRIFVLHYDNTAIDADFRVVAALYRGTPRTVVQPLTLAQRVLQERRWSTLDQNFCTSGRGATLIIGGQTVCVAPNQEVQAGRFYSYDEASRTFISNEPAPAAQTIWDILGSRYNLDFVPCGGPGLARIYANGESQCTRSYPEGEYDYTGDGNGRGELVPRANMMAVRYSFGCEVRATDVALTVTRIQGSNNQTGTLATFAFTGNNPNPTRDRCGIIKTRFEQAFAGSNAGEVRLAIGRSVRPPILCHITGSSDSCTPSNQLMQLVNGTGGEVMNISESGITFADFVGRVAR